MKFSDRILGFVVMGAIIAFAVIHVGVSIGIIVPYRPYGDVFRPQIGLSSYNLVIAILGLVTGVMGVLCIATQAEKIGKIVAIISGVLALFTLASLITALVLNSKSLGYLTNNFANHINEYQFDQGSMNIVDRLQSKYQCCGENIWLDWSRVGLNSGLTTTPSTTTVVSNTTVTVPTTTSTTPTTTTNAPTTTTTVTTTTGTNSTTPATTTTTTQTTTTTLLTTSTSIPSTSSAITISPSTSTIATTSSVDNVTQPLNSTGGSRVKRQAVLSYGGISNLPISFGVVLPGSCCASGAVRTSNASDAYCLSNANGAPNNFYAGGCAKAIDVTAGNQLMGFGVINSCLLILAGVAALILVKLPS